MKFAPNHPKTVKYCDYSGFSPVRKRKRIPLLKYAGKKVIGYKKAWSTSGFHVPVIVTLEFAANVRGQSVRGKKCRASRGKVLAINRLERASYGPDGVAKYTLGRKLKSAKSGFHSDFKYRVGEVVVPDQTYRHGTRMAKYNPELRECAAGIHFFLTLQEAMDYCL